MAKFTEEQVKKLEKSGNAAHNAIYLANFNSEVPDLQEVIARGRRRPQAAVKFRLSRVACLPIYCKHITEPFEV